MRKALWHYLLAIALGLLVFGLSYLAMLIPMRGYGALWFMYAFILFAQGVFYGLTAVHGRMWSIVGFILNFVLWTTELVQLEHLLDGSATHRFLYHNDDYYALRFILGGVLWATNKLIIDVCIGWVTKKNSTPSPV